MVNDVVRVSLEYVIWIVVVMHCWVFIIDGSASLFRLLFKRLIVGKLDGWLSLSEERQEMLLIDVNCRGASGLVPAFALISNRFLTLLIADLRRHRAIYQASRFLHTMGSRLRVVQVRGRINPLLRIVYNGGRFVTRMVCNQMPILWINSFILFIPAHLGILTRIISARDIHLIV